MDLAPDVKEWVERTVGGDAVAVEHQGRWRPHFFVDIERPDGEVVPVLVRYPRDPELVEDSVFLSHFDLAYEASVLERLQGTPVVTPRFYGFNPDVPAILMARVEGTNDLADAAASDRVTILREYFENLAVLHGLDVDADSLPGIVLPTNPEDLALANKFRYMERDYDAARALLRPEPLLEFAIWWLHTHVPQDRTESRWVQGDTGPGQFMHHDGHVTALIDWELSHIGDPMLDLGVMRMRNMIYPVGSLQEFLDYYAQVSGKPIHQEALCYYTVLSTLLTPLGLAVTIQQPDPGVGSMMPRFGWDVTLRRGLCDALCEAYGVDVDPPVLPEPGPPARTDLHRFLVGHLESLCTPIAESEFEQFLMRGAVGVARAVELDHQVGRDLESDDLDDMAAVLGWRPTDRESGLGAINDLVTSDPEECALDLLWCFSRMERRREHLWGPMMIAQESEPFERLFPAARHLVGPATSGRRS